MKLFIFHILLMAPLVGLHAAFSTPLVEAGEALHPVIISTNLEKAVQTDFCIRICREKPQKSQN